MRDYVKNRYGLKAALFTIVGLPVLSVGFTSLATSETSDGTVNILPTLSVTFLQQLEFGTIAPSLTSNSTVKVLRGQNRRSICGPDLTCFEAGNRARILVTGAPGQLFSVSDPGSTLLSDGNGNSMLVDQFVGAGSRNDSSFGAIRQLRADGTRNMNIGATLHIAANQPPGLYTGTYTLTANYE